MSSESSKKRKHQSDEFVAVNQTKRLKKQNQKEDIDFQFVISKKQREQLKKQQSQQQQQQQSQQRQQSQQNQRGKQPNGLTKVTPKHYIGKKDLMFDGGMKHIEMIVRFDQMKNKTRELLPDKDFENYPKPLRDFFTFHMAMFDSYFNLFHCLIFKSEDDYKRRFKLLLETYNTPGTTSITQDQLKKISHDFVYQYKWNRNVEQNMKYRKNYSRIENIQKYIQEKLNKSLNNNENLHKWFLIGFNIIIDLFDIYNKYNDFEEDFLNLEQVTKRYLKKIDRNYKKNYYMLVNYNGWFSYNSWLYAYLNDIHLVGYPFGTTSFDGDRHHTINDFIDHDLLHISKLPHVTNKMIYCYNFIMNNKTFSKIEIKALLFTLWYTFHEGEMDFKLDNNEMIFKLKVREDLFGITTLLNQNPSFKKLCLHLLTKFNKDQKFFSNEDYNSIFIFTVPIICEIYRHYKE